MTTVTIRFCWEWGATSPFWPADDAAVSKYGHGEIAPEKLGLPVDLAEVLAVTAEWHDTSLNWDYPPDPGPWRQQKYDRFNAKSRLLFEQCRLALDQTIALIYWHKDSAEDPELDRNPCRPKWIQTRRHSGNFAGCSHRTPGCKRKECENPWMYP
jgi:hypothetical protein